MSLLYLPHEVLHKIFSMVDPVSRCRCESVCKALNLFLNEPSLVWPICKNLSVAVEVIEKTLADEFFKAVFVEGNPYNISELLPIRGNDVIETLIVQYNGDIQLKKAYHKKLLKILKK